MRIWTFLLAVSARSALGASFLEERQGNWTVGQTVQTSSGPVSGHAAKIAGGVSEYLGIPFAKAPIGDLRWEVPQKFTGSAPLSGSNYGFSCPVKGSSKATVYTPQQLAQANATSAAVGTLAILSNSGANYSEDCLYLNVWTKPQVGEKKKAVLVWIYGGGFNSGSSSIPAYNGANWAELEDVVLVSFNYRLSVFGFPGDPTNTNNLAFLDQRMAVEWVRDNIANFGGDPTRITLFGQSAGGASVDLYSYAWSDDPIAAGFIPESGTAFSWGLPNSASKSAKAWYTVSQALGCGDSNSTDQAAVVACMKSKSVDQIFAGIPQATATDGILGYFVPTIDDKVVFANYTTRTPAKVPVLIGNNDYEAGLFRTTFALGGVYLSDTFWTDFNLQEFTCPAGVRANASIANNIPTWRYRYMGVFPNLAISPQAGTWHAAEVPMLFNIFPSTPAQTTEQISIGNYMRGAWATFAKDPAKGLLTYGTGWPIYDPRNDTLIRLAYNNLTGTNLINPRRYDADCVYVNISSSDSSNFTSLPDSGANVTPTGTVSPTGSATNTGSVATATKNAGRRVEAGIWVGLFGMIAVLTAGAL